MKLREVAIALHSMELNIQETKCFKKLFFFYIPMAMKIMLSI